MAKREAGSEREEEATFSWNLVAKNFKPSLYLEKKLHQKLAKLERHLRRFPPEAVHLTVFIERHPKKETYAASATLRVPSNILHAGKSAADAAAAFDAAVKALLEELKTLKAALRREAFWKRRMRREELREAKAAGFAESPLPPGEGPQDLGAVIRELFAKQYEALLRHARRCVRQEVLAGVIPEGAVDPRDAVDEAARKAVRSPDRKPAGMSWEIWFYCLLHQELLRQIREAARETAEETSVEELETDKEAFQTVPEPEDASSAEPEKRVPEGETEEGALIDATAFRPDQAAARDDLLEYIQQRLKSWPAEERQIFELHFVEGFEADEIAMILKRKAETVRRLIARIQEKIRELLLDEASEALSGRRLMS